MTGILQEKRGKYYCVLDYKDTNGIRKRKWINTGLGVRGNKRKATEFLNKLLNGYTKEPEYDSWTNVGNILFTDYMEQWLEKKKNKVDPITWQGYSIYVNKHIVPFFRNKKLTLLELKPHHIVDYYDFKFSSGRLDGKPGGLAARTIKSHSLIIKEVLDDALVKEIIPRNVASKVPLPKQKTSDKGELF